MNPVLEAPLEIEIGCGRGKFLMERAAQHPEIRFLGIDRVARWMKRRMEKIGKEGISNLQFLKAEIREVLKNQIPCETVDIFHIYFPDPWPKRRHRKRRLVNVEFLKLLYDRLSFEGRIEIATDDFDYFSEIKKAVSESGLGWRKMAESVNQRLLSEDIRTNYEMKYQMSGKDLYYLELVK